MRELIQVIGILCGWNASCPMLSGRRRRRALSPADIVCCVIMNGMCGGRVCFLQIGRVSLLPHSSINLPASLCIQSGLTLMLLAANLANAKWCKKTAKLLKPWHMGTHLWVLSESFPMNTNTTVFRWFSEIFASLYYYALDKSSLSIGRVNPIMLRVGTQAGPLQQTCLLDRKFPENIFFRQATFLRIFTFLD